MLALPGLAQQMPNNFWARSALYALLAGYVLSPFGHAGFGYLGMVAQSIQSSAAAGVDVTSLAPQVALFKHLTEWLHVHWLASVSASALGWLIVCTLTLRRRTQWPRSMAIANPLLLAPALGLLCAQWPDQMLAVYLGCASLNVAQSVFFSCALWHVTRRGLSPA